MGRSWRGFRSLRRVCWWAWAEKEVNQIRWKVVQVLEGGSVVQGTGEALAQGRVDYVILVWRTRGN